MRKTIVILLFFFCVSLYATSLETMRKYYFDVNTETIDLDDYEAFLEKNTSNNSVEWEGYRIMTWFLRAKDYFNPMSKLEAFQKGKNQLDSIVKANPDNVELRFLRLTIQENAPGFLGYKSNIATDKSFINTKKDSLSDTDLKNRITLYFNKK